MSDLATRFEDICSTPSDNNEHCLKLYELAKECKHVTELGVMFGRSTLSFLAAHPDTLVSYDIKRQKIVDQIEKLASEEHLCFVFKLDDSRLVTIDETDLLYIDTEHTYEQLKIELFRHGNVVQKYIVLHDTAAFPEMWKAIEEFLEQGFFQVKEVFTNNNGLVILERV